MSPSFLSVIVAASLSPGNVDDARAASPAETVEKVTTLHTAGRYADAARMADDNARREDLEASYRVLLGGLARQNYELSFDAGGLPAELCKAADVMRHVAPLDSAKGGAAKLKAAEDVEKKLERVLGPTWQATCMPVEVSPTAVVDPAVPPVSGAGADVDVAAEREAPREPPARSSLPQESKPHDRRYVRAGLGTLAPGLALFAPMSALLAYRAEGERDLTALELETKDRPRTEEDDKSAAALGQRYTAATAGAIALGVTGAALVVTGAVLLRMGKRPRRMAAAPWGARGAGGLVLEARF